MAYQQPQQQYQPGYAPQQGYAPQPGYQPVPPPPQQQQQSNTNVVVVQQQPAAAQQVTYVREVDNSPNHLLHCIITFFFFPWIFVWLILCLIYGC